MAFCAKCGTKLRDGANFCPSCGAPIRAAAVKPASMQGEKLMSSEPADDIPTFAPPADDIPIFTPPGSPARNFNGPVCFHHPDEPAVTQCARCGKYICRDCAEAYTVSGGEYANKSLCYDCCQEMVADNVVQLKKQKGKIIALFVATIIGMIIGAALFSETGSAIGIIFGMLWIGSFWTWVKSSVGGWWNNPAGRSLGGFIGACIGGAIIAPIKTVIKIVQCITYLIKTSKFIAEDTVALQNMKDYMEYTLVMSRNKGVDLETLMGQGSELYNNSYAQNVATQGEAAADAMLRQYTTQIAENGEIIRNFAA